MSGYSRLKIIPGSDLDKLLRAKGKKQKSVSIDKSKKETKAKEPVVLLPKPVALPKPKPKAKAKAKPKAEPKVEKPKEAPKVVKEAPENLYMYYDPRTKAEFNKDERLAKNKRFIFGTDVTITLADMLKKKEVSSGFLSTVNDKIKDYEGTIQKYLKGPPFDPLPYSQKESKDPTRQEMRDLIDEYKELKKLKKNYLDTFEKRKASVPLLKYKKEIVNKKAEYILVESSKVSVPQSFKRIKLKGEQLREFKGKSNPQMRNVTVRSLEFGSGIEPKLYRTPEEAKKHFF